MRLSRQEGPGAPEIITIGSRSFRFMGSFDTLYWWGYYLDRQGRIVGMDIHFIGDERIARSQFVTSTSGVSVNDFKDRIELLIDFSPLNLEREYRDIREFPHECAEAFPVYFYEDDGGGVVVFVEAMEFWIGGADRLAVGPDAAWDCSESALTTA